MRGCCATAGPIPNNGTCAIQVSFAPTASGTRTDTLVVNDDAPDAPHSAPLTGLGVGKPCDPAAPRANEIFWVNNGSGDWYTASNWSGGVLPLSGGPLYVSEYGRTATFSNTASGVVDVQSPPRRQAP